MGEQRTARDYPTCYRDGYNGTGSDISKGYVLKDDGTNYQGVALASAASDVIVGVSTETMTDGMTTSFQAEGKVLCLSGGVISAGQRLVADATGRVVAASAPSSTAFSNYVGRAVTAATGAAEWVEVELELGSQAFVGLATVATRAALKAIAAANRYEGMQVVVQSDYSHWVFDSDSTQVEDTADELVQQPSAGSGRWIRADKSFVMKIPIGFADTDALAIETIPAGMTLKLVSHPWWEVTTGWTGGVAAAIGISTSLTGYDTKGDLLGGAGGDVTATLGTAGIKAGTEGGELNDLTGFRAMLFVAATEIRFDRINDVFAAGAGFVCVPVVQMQNA
jgi:hypothetical protein